MQLIGEFSDQVRQCPPELGCGKWFLAKKPMQSIARKRAALTNIVASCGFAKRRKGQNMPRGKDGLYRRGCNILTFRYKDAAGAWRERSTGTADRKDAKLARQAFLDELSAGRLPTDMADWRLDQAEQWWNDYRRPRIAEGTGRPSPIG